MAAGIRLAIIANSQTPYRIHLHRRIARELSGVELHSVFTHETSNAPWQYENLDEIRPVLFGPGESALLQSRPLHQLHEWKKGGRIVRWLLEKQIDVVLINGYNTLGLFRIFNACHSRHIPILLWADSNIANDRVSGLKLFLKRRYVGSVLRKCYAALPCGSRGEAYFRKYGGPGQRVFHFPLEPDYALIEDCTEAAIGHALLRFGLDPKRRRIVFCGRLIPLKRVDMLLDAFAAIAATRPEWDLVILGDGELRQQLQARVAGHLQERVKWLGFISDQSVISAVYRGCDVLSLQSNYEAWALVVNEAAAAGLAIVCSDVVGSSPELVRDGVNGRTFPSENIERFIEALHEVTSPERIDRYKTASIEVLREWRETADPMLCLRTIIASLEQDGLIRRV